jgi:hypothetical protein
MSETDTTVAETIIPDEVLELEEELEDTEDVEALKENLEKERTAKQQILARAKKAEADLKALKAASQTTATQTTTSNALTADEIDMRVLKAQGMSDELIGQLSKVAKVTGKSLFDAQSDEIFIAMKTKHEAEEKAEKAKLGVSRGSGSAKKEKEINTPGLSEADHKELWRKQNGQ